MNENIEHSCSCCDHEHEPADPKEEKKAKGENYHKNLKIN